MEVEVKNNMVCALCRFAFTIGILVDVDEVGYSHRYCYGNILDAITAYKNWDGIGEPEGFIKRKGPIGQPDYSPNDPFTQGRPLCEMA